ncbi:tRNA ligase 1 isoform X2 [Spinacia oleracea]|uniref:tRNA ligase 1 isoform X2 n=1 Tax=Spinacia oleracea TaxID=3562 RepID=A0A9R0HST6_SPIOL|nr:tRNA ligase 1 isoform X2 [Spinacia oleracea]
MLASFRRPISPFFSSRPRTFFFLPLPPRFLALLRCNTAATVSHSHSTMPRNKGKGVNRKEEKWKVKSNPGVSSSTVRTEAVVDDLRGVSITEQSGQTHAPITSDQNQSARPGHTVVWKRKSYGTLSGVTNTPVNEVAAQKKTKEAESASSKKNMTNLSTLCSGKLLENFTVDNITCSHAQIRATFYPKFENEKSDQEIRTRMIEMVSNGLGIVEVSLKHSGSLFMYAGHEGGAYAKNSFGNIYTAVGVFVLGRMFREAWGIQASKMQTEFNDFLERSHVCVSMELVTAVLGDHGQRPLDDYVVVTAVTELGIGKPKFYSTPEVIAFCRKWRLPTNQIWLFSTRKSVTSFFAAFDALCEEGTATPVCKALDEVADITIPGTKDHVNVQGEILEGLVARIVSPDSSKHLQEVLRDCSPPPVVGAEPDLGPTLREICAANRSDEKEQIRALLHEVGSSFCPNFLDWFGKEAGDVYSKTADRSVITKFLQARPADYSTKTLQEMICLMREKKFRAAFKCYFNFHKADSMSNDNIHFKMVIHVHSDSVFRRYSKEMRKNPGLWPLYRGFFVDINLFKGSKQRVAGIGNETSDTNNVIFSSDVSGADSLADEDANLMVKLKFLPYKVRTFLIRNGLSILFKDGPAAYKTYYMRQMKIWGTSAAKQKELSKMLDEWAVYIRRKCGHTQLKSNVYLSEAESFLEQYAKRSPANQALIGAAGNLVRSEDFLAIVRAMDEEGDLEREHEMEPITPSPSTKDAVRKEGLIVFFPGIPGCAKSALCRELLSARSTFGDGRHVQSLMGDLTKARYWPKVAEECKRKPDCIMLADKNAPNVEVWNQIENMSQTSGAIAVPVIPDSGGTDSNPFCLDALSVFMLRVLQRDNHPGNLDKASPNAGYVLLMFYHLYEGRSRKEFEAELIERFGSLVKMPLLKAERALLPGPVKAVLEEGINLYMLHTKRHKRMESSKGSYAKEWVTWEKQLRETLLSNSEYLNSIQIPFESAVNSVVEQLNAILKGDCMTPSSEKRRVGAIIYAGISLPVTEINRHLNDIAVSNSMVERFFSDKNLAVTKKVHVTLAHKRAHGVIAVANFGQYINRKVDVELVALLFSANVAALEVCLGSVDDEKIESKNEWPHVTLWTASGVAAKQASTLPQLVAQGKASRIEIDPPVVIQGVVQFF